MKKLAISLLMLAFVFGITVAQDKPAAKEEAKKATTETVKKEKGCCEGEKGAKETCDHTKHAKGEACCGDMKQAKSKKTDNTKTTKKQEAKAPEAK